MGMSFTDDFRKVLRKNNKRFGEEQGFQFAVNEAVDLNIKPFRERKKNESRFKKQGSGTSLIDVF